MGKDAAPAFARFLTAAALLTALLGAGACASKKDAAGFDPSAPRNRPEPARFGRTGPSAASSELAAADQTSSFAPSAAPGNRPSARPAGPSGAGKLDSFYDNGGALPSDSALPDFKSLRASRPSAAGAAPGDGLRVDLAATARRVASEHPEIPPAAVQKAFEYYMTGAASNREYVAIADFDQPSTARRLKIIRVRDGAVESFLVAHGEGSGGLYATRFSNQGRSHESSLGLYLTGEQYDGEHGRSLKLRGMEASDSRAEARDIVIHAADYVSDAVAARGMLGRSWGCPAIDFKYRDHIINELAGGSVLLVYRSQPRDESGAVVAMR